MRRENDFVYPPPHEVRGRGVGAATRRNMVEASAMRRLVEAACGGRASFEADAPSTTLLRRVVPLPRFAGQDEVKVLA